MTVKNVSFATNFVSPAPRSAPATINCEDWNGWIKATIQRIWIHSVIQVASFVYRPESGLPNITKSIPSVMAIAIPHRLQRVVYACAMSGLFFPRLCPVSEVDEMENTCPFIIVRD